MPKRQTATRKKAPDFIVEIEDFLDLKDVMVNNHKHTAT